MQGDKKFWPKTYLRLKCSACGNEELFVEVMEWEYHLVGGDMHYIRLLEAEAERYECWECGENVEPAIYHRDA
ncbi:MAG: hypothetical protein HY000_15620 [Planctomycetes bacterium]|nr:hypothetical protein [Planctomycetota bacterium]